MSNRFRYTYGVQIEGLGQSTSKSGGLVFARGQLPTTGIYEWVGGLIDTPPTVDDSVNIYTGEIDTSSFRFRISNSDRAATKIFGVQAFTEITFDAGYNAAATTLGLDGTGSTSLAGTVIYSGDEAILLGTHLGSGQYSGCVRGYWSTTAQAHRSGDFVYQRTPYLPQRRVIVIKHDRKTGTETIVWRGFVDDAQPSDDGKVIDVVTLSLLSAISEARVNQGSPNLAVTGYVIDGQSDPYPRLYSKFGRHFRRVNKGASTNSIAMQVDDTLVFGVWSSSEQITLDSPYAYWWQAPAFEVDDDADVASTRGGVGRAYSAEGYEVLVIDRNQPDVCSTRDLDYPLHPVAIAMAFLLSGTSELSISGYDVLGPDWGLAVDSAYFDMTAITDLIESTARIEIDRLILGWDGDEVEIYQVITEKLLRPYGFTFVITQSGLVSVAFSGSPTDIGEGSAAQANPVDPVPPTLGWKLARDGQIQQATAEIGGLPWRDPDKVVLQARDGLRRDTRRRLLFSNRKTTYDFSTLDPSSDRTQVLTNLLAVIVRARTAAPIITILVGNTETTGVTYDLGAQIAIASPALTKPWAVDSDGNRVLIDPDLPEWVGTIISRSHDLERDVYTLDILLNNWARGVFVKWRAPNLVVTSETSSTWVTDTDYFTPDDLSYWRAGMYFTVWSPSGVQRGGSGNRGEILTITGTGFTSSGGTWTAVEAGDIVRVDEYPDSASTATIISGYTGRVWSYMRDAARSTDLDIWG